MNTKLNLTDTLCGASLFVMVLIASGPKEERISLEQKINIVSHDSTIDDVDMTFGDPMSCGL